MSRFFPLRFLLVFCITCLYAQTICAQATVRVDKGYEDSVRIVILWNNPPGGNITIGGQTYASDTISCLCRSSSVVTSMDSVGTQTRKFVQKSIDSVTVGTTKYAIPANHIKVLPMNRNVSKSATWKTIRDSLWGGDTLPHVIVHVNSGWWQFCDSAALQTIFDSATAKYIGIVEVGDDAGTMAKTVFGFTSVDVYPQPITDGKQYTNTTDTMFVGLYPNRDTLVDTAKYPHLKGIVRNATNILGKNRADFKPYDTLGNKDSIRCQADADQYTVQPSFRNKLTFLGYQDVSRNGTRVIGSSTELDVVVAFQDTINASKANMAIRRAVALSMQPQFLKNTHAMYQMVYDAIMFASLAWQLKPINKMTITASNDTMQAGSIDTLTAYLYRDTVKDTSSITNNIRWKLDSSTIKAGDSIWNNSNNMGKNIYITGTVAYRSIGVIASYTDSSSNTTISDTVYVYVKPDTSYRIYIVGANDTVWTTSNKNNPNPLDYITLDSATNHDTVYAVTYDKYNNWVGKAISAVWNSLDTSVVKAVAVTGRNFAGAVTRITKDPDTAYIRASQGSLIPDTLLVRLQNGTITDIRLVDCSGKIVTSVNITTDDTACLQIQVKWSNAPDTWVDGTGSWTLTGDSIKWVINPPVGTQTGNWTLDPVTGGKDSLTVIAGGKTKTIPITITEADPNKVTLTLLTSKDSLIAGDTILVEARIYNTDGLVSGSWCDSTAYSDVFISKKGPTWIPTATVNDSKVLTINNMTYKYTECFNNGIDTIKVVLYDAPYNQDTLHQIWISLLSNKKTLTNSTNKFILLPGPLDSIAIEDANFKSIDGPVSLTYPNGAIFFYSNGYDMYDNLIGHINTTWTKDGTLHPIDSPTTNIYRIYYAAVSDDQSGYITTKVMSGVNTTLMLYDSVKVNIAGSQASTDSAITRDENGNGYLDHIYVYFSKSIAISSLYDKSNVVVRYNVDTLKVDSVRSLATNNKVVVVYLHDSINADTGVITTHFPPPQTGWHPYITMMNLTSSTSINNYKCTDGAGPVIWRVVVNRNEPTDRTKDVVTVTFSEPIRSGSGGEFLLSTLPGVTFTVWKRDTVNKVLFDSVSGILAGINNFTSNEGDSIAIFNMTNKKTLFVYEYFNIISDGKSSYVADAAGNFPNANNQKVHVEIQGSSGSVTVGPNPFVPVITQNGGTLVFKNDVNAVNTVKTIGGTVIRIILAGGASGTTITGNLKIYDVVGNLVNQGKSGDNMLTENNASNDTVATIAYDIYWNGLNSKGMKVAPGGYMGIIYLNTTKNGQTQKSKLVCKIGIKR